MDSRKDVAQCEYCGQRSVLHTRGTPPVRRPPPTAAVGAQPSAMPVIEVPSPGRRIFFVLLLPLVLMIFISGLVYFIFNRVDATIRASMGGNVPSASFIFGGGGADDDEPAALPPQGSFLESPELLRPRIEQVADPPRIRHLTISGQTVEVYPESGERYSIHARGKPLRRGGAISVPETVIDLEQVDLTLLPSMRAKVLEATGSSPSRAVLSAPAGTPQWQLTAQVDGRAKVLYFGTDGTLLDE